MLTLVHIPVNLLSVIKHYCGPSRNQLGSRKTENCMKTETLTVKSPVQLLVGSFNGATNKHCCFIPVPLKTKGTEGQQLNDWAFDVASSMSGEGVCLRDDRDANNEKGSARFLLLAEEGNIGGRCAALPGNWIIDYTYDCQHGTESVYLYLAAEVV